MKYLLFALLVIAASAPTRIVEACGGSVSEPNTPVTVGGQRAFIAVRSDGTTDVVVQLDVSEAGGNYGVLLPLPVEPTVDATPIDASEFDGLDVDTQPVVGGGSGVSETGTGCACGGAEAGDFSGGSANVTVGSFTEVGPVTATALTADDTSALSAWLSDNGFEIPADQQSLVDAYVTAGSWFLAFKRNTAAPPGKSSVGIHFTLEGDHRGYPLRIAQLGAGEELAITVWISHAVSVTPEAPFGVLVPDDLAGVHDDASYRHALAEQVRAHDGRAFIVEHVSQRHDGDGGGLSALHEDGHTLTRLSTIIARDQLQQDVAFTGPPAPNVDTLGLWPSRQRPLGLLLVLAGVAALSLRRRTGPPRAC